MAAPVQGKDLLYLTQADVLETGLTPDDVLACARVALAEHGRKDVEMPAKIGLHPQVVAGAKAGREREDELIIDMNIGMGVEDVVLAATIFQRAREKGLGRIMPL